MLTTDFKSMKLSKPLSKTAIALAISRYIPRKTLMAIAVSSCIAAPDARATIYNVSEKSTCSLSDAIKAANTNEDVLPELVSDGDVICEAGSADQIDVINLLSDITFEEEEATQPGNAVPFIRSQITINGNGFTINRDAPNNPDPDPETDPDPRNFRFTAVASGTTEQPSHLTLRNLTFSGGYLSGFNGGALFVSSSASLTLNNVVLDGNHVVGEDDLGGAIYSNGTVIINNSTISNNTAGDDGGGIHANSGTLRLTNSTVSGNSAVSGGGIYTDIAFGGSVTLTKSSVSGNSAVSGGGIETRYNGSVTLTNSTVSGNSASVNGGGISARDNGGVTLTNSTVSGNSTSGKGGGITVYQYDLDSPRGTLTLANSTLSGNSASIDGGEIFTSLSTVTLTNNLLGDNTKTTAQVFSGFNPDATTNIIATSDGNQPTALANILSPLANNGGSTQTHALAQGSPAINAGLNSICNTAPISRLDQRGYLRTGVCDIGAFEFGASLPPPPAPPPPPPPFKPATIVPAINLLLDDE